MFPSPPLVLQASPIRVVGLFVLLAVLSTFVANTAAYFVLGDAADLRRAVLPGVAMATVMLSAVVLPTYAVVALALVVDFAAVSVSYDLPRRGTAMVTAVHYALTIALALFANYSLALYQTAPG